MSDKPSETNFLAELFDNIHNTDRMIKMETTAAEIKQLCGLNLEQLRNLLAAGAEIKMPERRYTYFKIQQKSEQDRLIEYIRNPYCDSLIQKHIHDNIKKQNEIYKTHYMGEWHD